MTVFRSVCQDESAGEKYAVINKLWITILLAIREVSGSDFLQHVNLFLIHLMIYSCHTDASAKLIFHSIFFFSLIQTQLPKVGPLFQTSVWTFRYEPCLLTAGLWSNTVMCFPSFWQQARFRFNDVVDHVDIFPHGFRGRQHDSAGVLRRVQRVSWVTWEVVVDHKGVLKGIQSGSSSVSAPLPTLVPIQQAFGKSAGHILRITQRPKQLPTILTSLHLTTDSFSRGRWPEDLVG